MIERLLEHCIFAQSNQNYGDPQKNQTLNDRRSTMCREVEVTQLYYYMADGHWGP